MFVQPMLPSHAPELAALQRLIFPTLAPADHIRAEQYLRHLELFPEGQFVLVTLDTLSADNQTGSNPMIGSYPMTGSSVVNQPIDRLIGSTTTMRTSFDFTQPRHTFRQIVGEGWLSHHQSEGDWLYGLDMMIHPAYQGRGGARLLYRARQQLVRTLGLRGQLTVGMPNGYGPLHTQLSGGQYYQQWLAGVRTDPTLSPQRHIGFQPLALIPDYLEDPGCGNYGVLLRLDAGQDV